MTHAFYRRVGRLETPLAAAGSFDLALRLEAARREWQNCPESDRARVWDERRAEYLTECRADRDSGHKMAPLRMRLMERYQRIEVMP